MGRFAAKGGNYKFSSGVCIVAFTFVLGSRYMRGNDYAHYVDVFNRRTEEAQRLFTWLNDFLSAIGFNGYGAFSVYALIFSTCLFYLLRRFKEYAAYMFPFALIALITFHESMIRQALSFSFVFLFLDQLLNIESKTDRYAENGEECELYDKAEDIDSSYAESDSKDFLSQTNEELIRTSYRNAILHILLCTFFAICAFSVHSANIIIIGILLIFWIVTNKNTIPFYISIPLILLSALVLNKVLKIEIIAPYLQLLQGSDAKLDGYLERSDYWFGEEGASDQYTRSGIILTLELWGYCALFWLSDRISKYINLSSTFATALNSLIIGSIIMLTFRELEIVNRMGYVLSVLWFIPLSISLYHIREFQFNFWEKLFLIGLAWWIYEYLKYLFMRNDDMTLFLWDAISSFSFK